MAKRNAARHCPCGSGDTYEHCCGRFLAGSEPAPGPEALMRSRYTAFVRRDADYLLRTWDPETRPASVHLDEPGLKWTGLEVRHAVEGTDGRGVVEFVARYKVNGRAGRLHEASRFRRHDGRWYYTGGDRL